jgi:hypothetical protein
MGVGEVPKHDGISHSALMAIVTFKGLPGAEASATLKCRRRQESS